MPKKYSRSEFIENQDFFLQEAKKHKIFVYPTDTIYGIGCISTLENKKRINQIKQSEEDKTLSVIAPSIQRVKNFYPVEDIDKIVSTRKIKNYMDIYGGVTFIILPKPRSGFRFIQHPFQNFVKSLQESFITTSVNPSGQKSCNSIEDIHDDILQHIDYIIDDGDLDGEASNLINLVTGKVHPRS